MACWFRLWYVFLFVSFSQNLLGIVFHLFLLRFLYWLSISFSSRLLFHPAMMSTVTFFFFCCCLVSTLFNRKESGNFLYLRAWHVEYHCFYWRFGEPLCLLVVLNTLITLTSCMDAAVIFKESNSVLSGVINFWGNDQFLPEGDSSLGRKIEREDKPLIQITEVVWWFYIILTLLILKQDGARPGG